MNPPLSRQMYRPRPVKTRCGPDGAPLALGGRKVEEVLEEWLVEDRWWTRQPLRRQYFELLLETGAVRVVFRDLESGGWLEQRG